MASMCSLYKRFDKHTHTRYRRAINHMIARFFSEHILYPLDEVDNSNYCMTQDFCMMLDDEGYEYLVFVPRLNIEKAPMEGYADYVEVPHES
jgi:hypothetical protein